MKLLTQEIIRKMPKFYSTEKQSLCPVIVKFFAPWSNWTWYVVEGEKDETGDWTFFGLVEGHETELGYFALSELQSVRGPMGLRIERDLYFENYSVNKQTNQITKGAN